MENKIKQCKSCPWRVDCVPDKDIPGYNCNLHKGLDKTIRSGPESMLGPLRVMACHYSKGGKERYCAGWLHNQVGPGNNIGVRLHIMQGTMPVPEVDGEQHETFQDTLPKKRRRTSR